MSDNHLRLIPTAPTYVPDAAAAEGARKRLAAMVPDADAVTATSTEQVEFVDQGANFERVSCPGCGAELDSTWWSEAMEAFHESNGAILDAIVPCCGTTASLNDLDYDLPAGFARFVLEAVNPNLPDLAEADVTALAAILGTPLRRIWARY